jgi:hypothetical protein
MSSVYGGSYVNIAASSAKGAHEGCLSRSEDKIDGFQARAKAAGHPSAVVQFERLDVYSNAVTDSHLATRAWTLQEKILPRRSIHFGHKSTLWECASKVATADLPDGLHANRSASQTSTLISQATSLGGGPGGGTRSKSTPRLRLHIPVTSFLRSLVLRSEFIGRQEGTTLREPGGMQPLSNNFAGT